MKKTKQMTFKNFSLWTFCGILASFLIISCGDDDPASNPNAGFTFEIDTNDPLTVAFTNTSTNASSYSWDFGDGASSSDENPSHTYAEGGDFDVTLTASDGSGTNATTQTVSLMASGNPLSGSDSKTWKLSRAIDAEEFPLIVGPSSRAEIWWAFGRDAQIGARPCLMEEEYVFHADGTFEYKTNGQVWAEEGLWNADAASNCVDETNAELMTGTQGQDLSAWGSGSFTYEYNSALSTLTLNGLGAHVGLSKVATDSEVTVPQNSVTYNVVNLDASGTVDKLALETTLTAADGYWRFNLVSYENASDEPELPGAVPSASFDVAIDGTSATFTNTSSDADSFAWDFGDGNMSTEESPTHIYAEDGQYTVALTATNSNGSATASSTVTIANSSVFSGAVLFGEGSKKWKLSPEAGALAVGPTPGSGEWFATSAEDVDTRACTFDDTYEFTSEGAFNYDADGFIWAEEYMGVAEPGCINESVLSFEASAWGSGSHTYTVAEAEGDTPAFITLNGLGAFIGLPKAFNGGEYAEAPPANDMNTYQVLGYVKNDDSEKLVLTIDISEGEMGGAWWTFIMIAE